MDVLGDVTHTLVTDDVEQDLGVDLGHTVELELLGHLVIVRDDAVVHPDDPREDDRVVVLVDVRRALRAEPGVDDGRPTLRVDRLHDLVDELVGRHAVLGDENRLLVRVVVGDPGGVAAAGLDGQCERGGQDRRVDLCVGVQAEPG